MSGWKSRSSVFYFLAFAPLVIIAYSNYFSGHSILGVFVPFYGFLLLLFKKDTLFLSSEAGRLQRLGGLFAMVGSLLAYYAVSSFSSAAQYEAGAVFYGVYLVGLFLAFFSHSTLRESFSAVFLVVVGGSSFYIGEFLEYYMEPLVPYFVEVMVVVLWALGIPVATYGPTWILLNTPRGGVPVTFEAGCIGIESFLVFSVIVIVTMMEESGRIRSRALWAAGGVFGAFLVNVLRVSLIAVVIYYLGYERWGEVHSWIGYALFLAWLAFFFAVFSKRAAIRSRMSRFWRKLSRGRI